MRLIFTVRLWKGLTAILVGVVYATTLLVLLLNIQGRISIESTDTFTYADTARQIAAGKGITTTIIQPNVAAPQMPQVTWPPMFSMLVAIPLWFGVSLSQAIMTTPVVLLALCGAVFLWYVARRWGLLAAVLFAAFSLTAAPLLHVASQPMTEAVFMGFSLLIVIVTWELFERRWGRAALVLSIVLGLLLSALGLLRYLGYAIAPGVCLLLLLARRRRELLVTLVGFGLTSLPLLARNFLFDRGYTNRRFPPDAGFFLNIQDAFVGIGKDFLHYLLWPSIRMVVALAAVAVVYSLTRKRREPVVQGGLRFGLLLLYLALIYLSGMVVMRSLFFFDKLNTPRFEAPVEWLALAGVSVLAAILISRVRWLAWIVGVFIMVQSVRTVPSLHRSVRHDRLPTSGRQVQWVAGNTESDSLILSNHGHAYNYFLGRTVVALRQYREPNDPAELLAWRRNWDAAFSGVYLILDRNLDPSRHTQFIVDLSNGALTLEWLQPLPDAPSSVRVYRIH